MTKGQDSKIEWTHHTFNAWRGCTKVSSGCAFCYAEKQAKRNPGVLGIWGDGGTRVVASESGWREPLKWNAAAEKAGERHRVFSLSMGDWLERRPELVAPRRRLLSLIRATPHLDWLLLSKRVADWKYVMHETAEATDDVASRWLDGDAPENVWVGASVENQPTADERIPHLLRIPGAVRFLSMEPLLGPVRIDEILVPFEDGQAVICPLTGEWAPREPSPVGEGVLHWVIVGGESGPHARPMHPDWARSLRDQCQAAGVAFFFKQWGEWHPGPGVIRTAAEEPKRQAFVCLDGHSGNLSTDAIGKHRNNDCLAAVLGVYHVGKKAAGGLLDGRKWQEIPATSPSRRVRGSTEEKAKQ